MAAIKQRAARRTARPRANGSAPPTRQQGTRDLEHARRVLSIEAGAIRRLSQQLDDRFAAAIGLLAACKGKVVVTGMGKSGQICRKMASTFASTGTPAFFLHAAEGLHGDAGMIMKGDVVVAVSNSGETEVINLLPIIGRLRVPLIALTGNPKSTLAAAAEVVLDIRVAEEACPMGLAPTASTTVTLALGDALAIALLERKGFGAEDFAVLHPGGHLGRRLLKVDDLAHHDDEIPIVPESATLEATLAEMSAKKLGITGVVNGRGELVGVISDGDLRRGLERLGDLRGQRAQTLMTTMPKTVSSGALAERALAQMEQFGITSLFVLAAGTQRPVAILHMHDLLRAGVV